MSRFSIVTLTPACLLHPGLALAAARAGAIAVLDCEHCNGSELDQADRNLRRLIELAGPEAMLGLRLHPSQIETSQRLLDQLHGRPHWLLLTGWLDSAHSPAPLAVPGRSILLEMRDAREAPAGATSDWAADGWIARGSECGGWIGSDSAFILAQKLLAVADVPVYVQGGIGPANAGGCRAAGAAGVVLDDQLLLMPESPLPPGWRRILEEVSGQDAVPAGESPACRVLVRPGLLGAQRLQRLAAELAEGQESDGKEERWRREAGALLGWNAPEESAWPMGQAITLATGFRDRYQTTGRLIQAVLDASEKSVDLAARLHPLAPDSPLARSHGTRFPIVQGPMTRVSDSPAFAEAVAAAGGLPLLALALMSGDQARVLMAETRRVLGERPWGVGILGFVPPDRRDEQLAALIEARPPLALIAGGRPDHAAELERHGVPTYLHVPVPKLLPMFLEGGTRRFIFEGRECGGHVGPLSSFVLWESMIGVLLREVPKNRAEEIHILFAGGIHDAVSAAMVAALATPLAERGMKVGVLMGSAYLFTREAVSCGAIGEEFQQQALSCTHTVKLKTGPGHVVRCAPSPFVDAFEDARRRMTAEGTPAEEINDTLARLALGRSRVAAKGLLRDGDDLVPLDRERQRREGMFMMGSIATMRSSVCSVEELHSEVSEGSRDLLDELAVTARPASSPKARPADVAVIGVACLLPGAPAPRTFWKNILDKTGSIREIPRHRFDWRLLYSPDTKERDKSYSKWGGFLDEVPFDPVRFGIPPSSMPMLSTSQLLSLEVARQALADAGYENGGFDRENTSVILGAAANGDLEQGYMMRSLLPYIVDAPTPEMWKRLPEWSDESFAGVLANVTAGRIANRLDLGGANYTVDAACASSLTAIDLAVHELRGGHSSMVVAGGLDLEQHPHFYLGFSRTQAFSPRGKVQTFDRAADGIVISEGVVVVVLKRLADAERDGDRIYAVIKGIAGSSDGKGLGMTAPRPIGQRRALTRAYRAAGFPPSSIGLYEAHGTGTPVGDRAELETIVSTLNDAGASPKSCAIGSVKTLIGHTKAAAGMAGLTKAIYSLYYRTLPPHAGVEQPVEPLTDTACPAYLLREARPWFENGGEARRAGVSAFGFGGTNFHAVLEEYRGNAVPRAVGADEWPCELFTLRGSDRAALISEVRSVAGLLAASPDVRLSDLAAALAARAWRDRAQPAVIAVVASSIEHLCEELERTLRHLEKGDAPGPATHIGQQTGAAARPVAFLFPGQGAQHPNMCRELAVYLPEVREAIELADRLTAGSYEEPLSKLVYPGAAFDAGDEQRQTRRVEDTHLAQPAIGAVSLGLFDLARRLGLEPAMVGGHSFGELTALHAAGVLDRETFLRLAETRGRLMAASGGTSGAMAALSMPAEAMEGRLGDGSGVVVANRNAPEQCVISGPRQAVEAAVARLTAEGATARMLPVSGAFHSPLMAAAEQPLIDAIAGCAMESPRIPVYGNTTAKPYPADASAVRSQLESHLRSAVDFAGQIREMAHDGASVFIELGPKSILTGLVQQNLAGAGDHVAVSFGMGGLRGFLDSLSTLIAAGVAVDVPALFAGRDVKPIEVEALATKAVPNGRIWWVDGGGARHSREEPRNVLGTLPRLDLEAVQAAAARPPVPAPISSATVTSEASDLLKGYAAYQETMRQFLATQESVMARFLGGANVSMPALPAAAPMIQPAKLPQPTVPEQAVPPPSAVEPQPAREESALIPAALDFAQLAEMIVRLASQETGYPPEVLGLEQDIEAELGIDSIKRMELVDAVLRRTPEGVTGNRADELLRLKTFKGWIEAILRGQKTTPALPAVQAAGLAGHEVVPESAVAVCPRFIVAGHAEPAPLFSLTALRGLFLVTEDDYGIAQAVADSLRQLGAGVAVLSREALASAEDIDRIIDEQRADHGQVQGLVHLAPLTRAGLPETLNEWRQCTQTEVKSLFHLIRRTVSDLRYFGLTGEAYALGATLLGGAYGRNGICGPGSPAGGGNYGLLKTLATEIIGVNAKTVDFDDVTDIASVVPHIVNELLAQSDDFEIGYAEGTRFVFRAEEATATAADPPIAVVAKGDVILVTGGARGITAEIAREIAQPGVHIVLAGRSPEPAAESRETAALDTPALRRHLVEVARAAGEAVTPALVEERVQGLLQRREIRDTLALLRGQGAEVEYRVADVRREHDLGALIGEMYSRYGRIDAVVHGAGIIEDRLIDAKDPASFDRVFDTKADSAFLLSRLLRPDSLKWLLLFSSVAGRIGNRGQIDYAAANEVVNRMAWWMSAAWPKARVVAVNWGPWSGAGMASAGVIRQLEEQGIRAINPAAGRRFFTGELTSGARDAEVLAGEGYWNAERDSLLMSIFGAASRGDVR